MNIACFLPPAGRAELHALMSRIERGALAGASAPSALGLGPDSAGDLTPALATYCATAQFDRAESILSAMKVSGEWPVAEHETAMGLLALAAHGLASMSYALNEDAPAQWAINFVFELAHEAFPPAASKTQATEAR